MRLERERAEAARLERERQQAAARRQQELAAARKRIEDQLVRGKLDAAEQALEAADTQFSAIEFQPLRERLTALRREAERAGRAVDAARREFRDGDHRGALTRLEQFTPEHPAVTSALVELRADAARFEQERAAAAARQQAEERRQQELGAARDLIEGHLTRGELGAAALALKKAEKQFAAIEFRALRSRLDTLLPPSPWLPPVARYAAGAAAVALLAVSAWWVIPPSGQRGSAPVTTIAVNRETPALPPLGQSPSPAPPEPDLKGQQERPRATQTAEQGRLKQAADEQAPLKQAADDQARAKQAADEQARLKQVADEQARTKAAADEQARLKQAADEQARLKADEQARLKAAADEQARLKRAADEQAQLKAEQERAKRAIPAGPGDRERIADLLDAYRAAYESMDVAAILRLQPAAPQNQLKAAFRDYEYFTMNISNPDVQISGNAAVVTSTINVTFKPRVGNRESFTRRMTLTLQKTNESWIIVGRRDTQ
jgi:hypothetical protein